MSLTCENCIPPILMIFSSFVSVKIEFKNGHESQCE